MKAKRIVSLMLAFSMAVGLSLIHIQMCIRDSIKGGQPYLICDPAVLVLCDGSGIFYFYEFKPPYICFYGKDCLVYPEVPVGR